MNHPISKVQSIIFLIVNVIDLSVRALIAIGISCDVCLNVVPGVILKTINIFYKSDKKHEGRSSIFLI